MAMTGLPRCAVAPAEPPRGCTCSPCTVAAEKARAVSDRLRDGAAVELATEETANEWFRKYIRLHEKLGNTVTEHPGAWKRWCAPVIGTKPIAMVTTEDIRTIRNVPTAARLDGKIGAKRAFNVWSFAIKAPLSRAFTDDDPKYGALRVGSHAANPAQGI